MGTLRAILAGVVLAAVPVAASAAPPTATPSPLCFGEHATMVGSDPDFERIYGTPGDDVIFGGRGFDKVFAGAGNDLICAGRGSGEVFGGPGDDRVRVHRGNLAGGGGDDVLIKRGGGDENTLARGGTGDDRVRGLDPGDGVWPGRGRDVVHAHRGNVKYDNARRGITVNLARHVAFGEGRDRLYGIFLVDGSRYADTLIGDSRYNLLVAYGGDDTLVGRAGRDQLGGGGGHDRFDGGPGADYCDATRREVAVSCSGRF